MILWNGPTESTDDEPKKKSRHNPSRADDMDNSHIQHDIFPPAPVATTRPNSDYGVPEPSMQYEMGPMAANSILGGAFGSSF